MSAAERFAEEWLCADICDAFPDIPRDVAARWAKDMAPATAANLLEAAALLDEEDEAGEMIAGPAF